MRICPAHLEYARELDRNHGRAIAKNYLRKVLDPDYMSTKSLGAVKHAEKSLEKAIARQPVPEPPEGWQAAAKSHIKQVGDKFLAVNPDIEPKSLEKAIGKTYPFGSKQGKPYKLWLKELRAFIKQFRFDQTNRLLAESYTPKQMGQWLAESYLPPKRRHA